MRHAFIDIYADLNTPLHKLGAKTKIVFWVAFLLLIILSPGRRIILVYGALVTLLAYLSKVPVKFIFKKLAEVMPFVIVVALAALFKKNGIALFLNCAVKAALAIILTLVIFSTTKFTLFLEALKQLKVPGLFISILSFMYRYSFLLEDQLLRAKRAYESRSVNGKNNFGKVRILCNILGIIFIRVYERAERVHLAMCARGYTSEQSNRNK
jgi:cobalt/nickel transport system permease protein